MDKNENIDQLNAVQKKLYFSLRETKLSHIESIDAINEMIQCVLDGMRPQNVLFEYYLDDRHCAAIIQPGRFFPLGY